jgi:hypothetical protein
VVPVAWLLGTNRHTNQEPAQSYQEESKSCFRPMGKGITAKWDKIQPMPDEDIENKGPSLGVYLYTGKSNYPNAEG